MPEKGNRKSLKITEEELVAELNQYKAIFNSRTEGGLTTDNDCTITTFNRAAEQITGYKAEKAIGRKCWEIINSTFCRTKCAIGMNRSVTLDRKCVQNEDVFVTTEDDRKVAIRLNHALLFDNKENLIGLIENFQDITEIRHLRDHLRERFELKQIIGKSPQMEKIFTLIDNVSRSDSTVLITGESGTGKELIARSIHLNSHRKNGPFIALNCSAFAETLLESELFGHEKGSFTGAVRTKQGRFELAQGGTLFLDEIGDISLPLQIKLLRILESRQFERVGGVKPIQMDVRLMTATNKILEDEVADGRFRKDLYYRINVFNLNIPPLRERLDDLPLLIQNLLEKNSNKFKKEIYQISPAALTLLKSYDWPGNVRELENVLEHAFVMCHGNAIEVEHFPERMWVTAKDTFMEEITETGSPFDLAEKALILSTLQQHEGHRFKTAEALGITTTTLWRKMKKHGLS